MPSEKEMRRWLVLTVVLMWGVLVCPPPPVSPWLSVWAALVRRAAQIYNSL
jgi:hypothetical protein